MFDSIVRPIICYGSEIWGYEYSKSIEKEHSQSIGLNQNSADFFVLSECGRYPLAVTYFTYFINTGLNFFQIPDHRYPRHRGSYMSAHVLLNLLNELGKRDKMRGLPNILSLFRNEINKFNNTRARMLDSIYHMTNLISGVKTL